MHTELRHSESLGYYRDTSLSGSAARPVGVKPDAAILPEPFALPARAELDRLSRLDPAKRVTYELLIVGPDARRNESLAVNLQGIGKIAVTTTSMRECWTLLDNTWQPDGVLLDLDARHEGSVNLAEMLRRRTDARTIFLLSNPAHQTISGLYRSWVDLVVSYPMPFSQFAIQLDACLGMPRSPRSAAKTTPARTHRLTPVLQKLLCALWQRRGEIVSPDELNRLVWGNKEKRSKAAMENRLRVNISRLRHQLQAADSEKDYLGTVYGNGYVLHGLPDALRIGTEEYLRNTHEAQKWARPR